MRQPIKSIVSRHASNKRDPRQELNRYASAKRMREKTRIAAKRTSVPMSWVRENFIAVDDNNRQTQFQHVWRGPYDAIWLAAVPVLCLGEK